MGFMGNLILRHKIKHVKTTETGKHALVKFIYVFAIFLIYSLFVINKYGAKQGISIAALTWTFFVFCTPIADAGFLLAFPIRLVSNIRMIYTQLFSYILASLIVAFFFIYNPAVFEKTIVLKLFEFIITHPIPYFSIIILSAIGTFTSIHFGDELMDVVSHKERKDYHKHGIKYEFIVTIGIIALTLVLYQVLISQMGLEISLI